MATARSVVLSVLSQWFRPEDPPLIPERDDPAWSTLSAQDRAFAFDLVTGVIRYRGLLDAVVEAALNQSPNALEPIVRAILWMGTFQLLLQSNPAYAAVDSSVALAKQTSAARAAGLINAGLRNVTRLHATVELRHGLSAATFPLDFTHQIRFNRGVFPDPMRNVQAHIAAITSHPQPLVKMLISAYGESATIDLLIRNNVRPTPVLRSDQPDWQPPADARLIPHQTPGFFVPSAGWNPAIETLVEAGDLSPQDTTSAKPVAALVHAIVQDRLLPLSPGPLRVLDLCAGLGTKTVQLARNLTAKKIEHFPLTQITACDVDWNKLEKLTKRVRQLSLTNVSAALASTLPQLASPVPFHIALVDVPCSNTGVMGRRMQSRWRWPALKHGELHDLQLKLLQQTAAVLSSGALLVYSTCSIDPAENAGVVQRFLAETRNAGAPFAMHREETTLPSLADSPETYCDGGYFALLKKL
jgi:16S rRNA (cytosine967-C5)-methyltransferase